jgi:hypothetical protein
MRTTVESLTGDPYQPLHKHYDAVGTGAQTKRSAIGRGSCIFGCSL